jgi:UDP-N-acetylmuramoylalanine-D-glutamate ligase
LAQGIDIPHAICNTLSEAFEYACKRTSPPATILLSPGFASFGMFKNEFDRGDQFREIVLLEFGDRSTMRSAENHSEEGNGQGKKRG